MISKKCIEMVNEFFCDSKKSWLWWHTNNPVLGNRSPIEMIRRGKQKQVEDFICTSIENGRPL